MGATDEQDTVDAALRDDVERVRRVEAAQRHFDRGQRGDFDDSTAAHEAAKAARKQAFSK